ncbi:MAG TPA: Rne/Rng family ribonuclease [Candidatus Azoamicus sp. MARI]
MNKKILISKNKINEIRVALIEHSKLFNFEIESEKNKQQKGNIYKGFVSKIEPSLDAIFINYGSEKDGFLPFKEITKEYLDNFDLHDGISSINNENDLLGKDIIIQIEKEERENKGASVTTYISLAGYYLVLMPYNNDLGGISKKIKGQERYDIKEKINNINTSKDMGIIVRTLGIGKSSDELKWELNILLSQLSFIKNTACRVKSPFLIHEENSLIIRSIRDYLKPDVNEIIIDDINIFNLIYKYLNVIKSDFLEKITLYNNLIPLFNEFKVENQIELAFKREIFLPSGGSITIDFSEALISIDINSSKSNKCFDIEETALQTNLEAIDEIARQLRIRDLGGLVIIDFIDMNDSISQFLIEKKFQELLSIDKAKIHIGKISKFGLLELSRQRLKSSSVNSELSVCKNCLGTGKINNIDSISINILTSLEDEIVKKETQQICLELTPNIFTYMSNIKKNKITEIEIRYKIKIILLINENLSEVNYKIYRLKYNNKKIRKNKK